ncbi:hypothetical protein OIU77_000435 [Salix suchowensis]|nr:hypothetical protein OIU77_000435 [Salix suchowensis]
MAKIIHKLFSKTTPTIPSLRIITSTLRTPQVSDPDYLTAAATTSLLPTTTKSDFSNNPVPLLNPIPTQDVKPLQFYYPNFPFGFSLNPISATGLDQLKAMEEEEDVDDSRTLWADSVKKKRKRKMNKHKYQKLRKRLRRKSS